MGISYFNIAATAINLLLAYLAVHVTLHAPDEAKKRTRKRQFIILGIAGLSMFVGQEINNYSDRKHEKAVASVIAQARAEQDAKLVQQTEMTSSTLRKVETLLTNSCSGSKESSAAAQQCVTEIQKLSQALKGSGLQAHTSSQPTERPFVRSWALGFPLSNPFEKLFANPGLRTPSSPSIRSEAQSTGSPQKDFLVPLAESVLVSEKVATANGHCVDQYGLEGGDCATEACDVLCVGGIGTLQG